MYDNAIQNLIDQFARLPGIGPKSAQRIAFWMLDQSAEEVATFSAALLSFKAQVHFCQVCFSACEGDLCRICVDERRDLTTLCVVEETKDVFAIERTREFRGRYHVLGGNLSPIDGNGPENLHLRELMSRLAVEPVQEIIIATNPNVNGDATCAYITRLLRPFEDISVSRLASGLPVGGDLEYADEVTLGRAFKGRTAL
ncbi:MAG: recombination mediator RecR [Propionibacteriaceae bacterium]|jgi:recombination protein RecR|nr:recombination mediator RecR [Propionibacteriaceae bacterium]